jgi:hypothetical protein
MMTSTQRIQLGTIGLQETKKQILVMTGCFLAAVTIVLGNQYWDQLSSHILEARKSVPDIVVQRDGNDLIIRSSDAIASHTWLNISLAYDPDRMSINPSIVSSDGMLSLSQSYTGRAIAQVYYEDSILNNQILLRIRGAFGS